VANVEVKVFPIEALREFCARVFMHFRVPEDQATQAADVLAAADLRGIDSHGVARMSSYVDLLSQGLINPKPEIKVVRSTPSTATVDGDNGLGLVVGPRANQMAIEMAEKVGSGWISVRNTNHYGIAGYYVLKAAERDMIGWAMTNSSALVTPLWGMERMLGTNPIAIAFPGKKSSLIWLRARRRMEKSKSLCGRGRKFPRVGRSITRGESLPSLPMCLRAERCCRWDRIANVADIRATG
jgi:LDH2 family malate/lactate/ureidoglycolate dehydrogenase